MLWVLPRENGRKAYHVGRTLKTFQGKLSRLKLIHMTELKDFRKNSINKGKQNHICLDCCRQFIEQYETTRNYSDEMKRDSVKIYVNGMGFRGKELIKGAHHNNRHYQRSL